jgi:hypothetical protein
MLQFAVYIYSGTLRSKLNAQELALHSTNAVHTILTDAVNLVIEAGTRIQSSQKSTHSGQLDVCPFGSGHHLTLLCSVKSSLC